MKKILHYYILYRLPIIIVLIGLGILSHYLKDEITAWLLYILAFFSLLLYFMMGTMRIVQEAVTDGEVEKAQEYLKKIYFPRLLFKPVRSAFYMIQSNLFMATDNLAGAESNIRKSMKTKSKIVGDMEGANLMQLAFIQLKKGEASDTVINTSMSGGYAVQPPEVS